MSKQIKLKKKDYDKYSEYESYQFLRTEYNQFGHITVIRHPKKNDLVYMKEKVFHDRSQFERQILK